MKHILLVFSLFLAFSWSVTAQIGVKAPKANQAKVSDVVKVFPNPASQFVTLTVSDQVAHFVVYNVLGRPVKKYEVIEGGMYDIAELPPGMYLIQLVNNQNKIINTQRLHKR